MSLVTNFAIAANCDGLKGCEAKICDIETNLEVARKIGNNNKISGLEKALKETRENCTDASLKEKYQAKIDEKKSDVKEVEKKLEEAHKNGDAKKIKKLSKKLEEKKADAEEAVLQKKK